MRIEVIRQQWSCPKGHTQGVAGGRGVGHCEACHFEWLAAQFPIEHRGENRRPPDPLLNVRLMTAQERELFRQPGETYMCSAGILIGSENFVCRRATDHAGDHEAFRDGQRVLAWERMGEG